MDAPEDEQPIQAEDMENLGSTEGGDAPCTVVAWAEDGSGGRGGGGKNLPINVPIRAGNGGNYGSNP